MIAAVGTVIAVKLGEPFQFVAVALDSDDKGWPLLLPNKPHEKSKEMNFVSCESELKSDATT